MSFLMLLRTSYSREKSSPVYEKVLTSETLIFGNGGRSGAA